MASIDLTETTSSDDEPVPKPQKKDDDVLCPKCKKLVPVAKGVKNTCFVQKEIKEF